MTVWKKAIDSTRSNVAATVLKGSQAKHEWSLLNVF